MKQWINKYILGSPTKKMICKNCNKLLNKKSKCYYQNFIFCNIDYGIKFFEDCTKQLLKIKNKNK